MYALLLTLLTSTAPAAELAGVSRPDSVQLADTPLVLNGLGLREFLWIDVYVGGLYLPEKTSDPTTAIDTDVPKRITMDFIFRKVGRDKVLDTFRDGLAEQKDLGDLSAELAKLESFMDRDVVAGDTVVLDYEPGKGVTVTMNGDVRGTIGDQRFMRGIWAIFLGDAPASEKLKKGMLGR